MKNLKNKYDKKLFDNREHIYVIYNIWYLIKNKDIVKLTWIKLFNEIEIKITNIFVLHFF